MCAVGALAHKPGGVNLIRDVSPQCYRPVISARSPSLARRALRRRSLLTGPTPIPELVPTPTPRLPCHNPDTCK